MFSRRVLHTPLLRQFGRISSRPIRPFHAQRPTQARFPRDDRPAFEYDPNKHQQARPLFTPQRRHYNQSAIILLIGGTGGVIFYASNIEEVPITKRRRFNCYSDETVAADSDMIYQDILRKEANKILPTWDPRVRQVERVLNRLLPVSGMGDADWHVHVIDEPETQNAFVIPGNKVFVYSGILPICQTDDGLAAVLAHEIAHNVAKHAAERMSQFALIQGVLYTLAALDVTGGLGQILTSFALDLGIMRPASRQQESEADYIGLLMMAEACYDPQGAITMWKRMKQREEAAGNSIPQFMSTHPSNENRISRLSESLPKAESILAETDCSATGQYSRDFISTWGNEFGVFK